MSHGPGPSSIAASALGHAAVLVPLLLLSRPPEPIEFETIQINLVAASEPTPTPAPAEPEPQPDPVETVPEPDPEPEPEPEPPPEPEREPEPDVEKPPETPEDRPPAETPSEEPGGDEVDLSVEGFASAFPEYMENIVTQIYRYFRWGEDSQPRGEVYFEITRDGSVRNLRMVRSSGNRVFDIAVQGAVETAGNRGAFGPLPDAFAGSSLPVRLVVEPPR